MPTIREIQLLHLIRVARICHDHMRIDDTGNNKAPLKSIVKERHNTVFNEMDSDSTKRVPVTKSSSFQYECPSTGAACLGPSVSLNDTTLMMWEDAACFAT